MKVTRCPYYSVDHLPHGAAGSHLGINGFGQGAKLQVVYQ